MSRGNVEAPVAGCRGRLLAGGPLVLAFAALALTFGIDSARAAFPGANGRLAFGVEEWRLPDPCLPTPHGCEPEVSASSIETVLASGRGHRVLRSFPVGQGSTGESGPKWSPNGRLLAFQQGSRIAILRADGTGLRQLPQLTGGEGAPTWSPNGRRLAFSGRSLCCNWLYTVRRDGTALRLVKRGESRWPAWSITGTIAFVNYDDRNGVVGLRDGTYSIRPDGAGLRRLFGRTWGTGQQPDWSPDGSRIAFVARRHIYTMSATGGRLRRLTGPSGDSAPAWSPDGKYIAFIRDWDVYITRASGRGRPRRVFDAPDQDLDHPERPWAQVSAPSWQPSGR